MIVATRRGTARSGSVYDREIAAARRSPVGPSRRGDLLAAAVLAACIGVDAAIAARALDPQRPVWFLVSLVATVVAITASAAAVHRRLGSSLRRTASSPFAMAAATWLVLFVLRPLELYVAPEHSALALSQLGFGPGDLTRTNALAGLGCATWCAGYLLALGRRVRRPVPAAAHASRPPLRPVWALAALAFGTLLWGALFARQGGLNALIHAPASIRVNQGASFYGFIGVWLVQGVTLYALAVLLRAPTLGARLVFVAGSVVTVAAGTALQLRSLTVFTAVAAGVIYLAARRPRGRVLLAGAVVLVCGVLVLGATQRIRAYSNTYSTSESVELTFKSPLWSLFVSDLSTYDNFVEMQILVPGSIDYLGGRTLAEIPAALVPRSLWPDKPLGIDFRVAAYLYPGIFVGVPISLQGELYWNGGIPLVAIGALLLGLALGWATRVGHATAAATGVVLYSILLPFTHGLLTRGLATTIQNLVFAYVGVGLAVVASAGIGPSVLLHGAAAGLRRVTSALPRIGTGGYRPSSRRHASDEG